MLRRTHFAHREGIVLAILACAATTACGSSGDPSPRAEASAPVQVNSGAGTSPATSTALASLVASGSEGVSQVVQPAEGPIRWIAAASGATPEQNQLSIESDLALALRTFRGPRVLLFAAGPTGPTVQVQRETAASDDLRDLLGDFFSPRSGRRATYRPPSIPTDGAATKTAVLEALDRQRSIETPLFVYLGGHGERGETPLANHVALWGHSLLTVAQLAEALDRREASAPVRVVVTTCFSGGFAELAFRGGEAGQGLAPRDRCGFFATAWDLEAAGCDPNPDHLVDSYAPHYLNALGGRDHTGASLSPEILDLDQDGRVSLSEAHARARIASDSIDVPTSTSARWLEHVAPPRGRRVAFAWPEEEAVAAALAKRTGLSSDLSIVHAALGALESEIDAGVAAIETAAQREDEAFRQLSAELYARWPIIDDPWHPEFEAFLHTEGPEVLRYLEGDGASGLRAYRAARDALGELEDRRAELRRRAAPIERLVRSLESLDRARRLAARGGRDHAGFLRILACERTFAP